MAQIRDNFAPCTPIRRPNPPLFLCPNTESVGGRGSPGEIPDAVGCGGRLYHSDRPAGVLSERAPEEQWSDCLS